MKNIMDLSREELGQWLENKGIRSYRANQIFKWLYLKLVRDFDSMTDLGKPLRETLSRHFTMECLTLVDKQTSADTTEKFLHQLADGEFIESVLIPAKDTYTLCVSSQVGCAMDCRFCLTARNGLKRNLTMGEIVAQIREARAYVQSKGIDPLKLSNIVFMGMGEPLANYKNLIRAMAVILDTDYGMKFATRRVTVSTSGLVPKIIQLGLDTDVNLAISLNATDNKTRSQLMPINNTYPIEDLVAACRKFSMKPRNKITFEYILMAGVNDSDADAKRLVRLVSPLRAKINLIPFNEHEGAPYKRPSKEKIHGFLKILLDRNMTAIIRKSKGDDISAACGQLKAKQLN